MNRYYVFPDKNSAQTCVTQIDARARTVYVVQGYQLDKNGAIIGKNAATGASMPDATKTATWDIPRQRADGKWVVRHCEAVPGNTFVLDPTKIPPLTVAAFVGQDIGPAVTIEQEGTAWWPAPHSIQVGA